MVLSLFPSKLSNHVQHNPLQCKFYPYCFLQLFPAEERKSKINKVFQSINSIYIPKTFESLIIRIALKLDVDLLSQLIRHGSSLQELKAPTHDIIRSLYFQ